MSKTATTGKRYLEGGVWHDANGPVPGSLADWDPPMRDEEITAAALSDPDARPLTDAQLGQMRRDALARHVRWKLGLSQAEFSARFHIPLGTLRDWEQHRTEPDAAASAYLRVILDNPEAVDAALAKTVVHEAGRGEPASA